MATLTIIQPIAAAAALSPHPKARIRAENGVEVVLPYAPRGTQLGGFADKWDTLDRPGRKPLVMRGADGLLTCSLSFTLARLDHQASVEDYIDALKTIAGTRQRVTLLNLSPQERGPWRVSSMTITGELRQHGTNAITRATVALELVEASDPNPQVGPVAGGSGSGAGASGPGKGKWPKSYTVKKNDTLRTIANKFYGDPGLWQRIGKANNIKKPTPLKVGRKLKIPAPPAGTLDPRPITGPR